MNERWKALYYGQEIRFPIIGAVLEDQAEGKVYYDSESNPNHIFVVSEFGFCQEIFRVYDSGLFDEIKGVVESDRRKKMRWYDPCPSVKKFLDSKRYARKAKRRRYVMDNESLLKTESSGSCIIRPMGEGDLKKEDFGLDLSSRYYRNGHDLIQNAMPLLACDNNDNQMGIIYSAGNDRNMCEVDILVKESYRKQGIAAELVKAFTDQCRRNHKTAVWDCYANLTASCRLAEKSGFILMKEYDFYNIELPEVSG